LQEAFTIGDIALASAVKTLSYAGWSLDGARYPKLAAWYARVSERAAWKKVAEHEAAVFAALSG
jgi:glutathione S-transferase